MKRWDISQMLDIGRKLFTTIHKKKAHVHHNNEIHYMAREVDEWLPQGIKSIANGSYSPRCLKRYYFSDEVVDQLHLSDRIMQHVLLKQLKPTFKHVMNPNVYHLSGPTGVMRPNALRKFCKKTNQSISYALISSHFTHQYHILNCYTTSKNIMTIQN